MTREPAKFATEAELCAAFIKALPQEWTAYPETGGFDILLSRNSDGFQIGVEAKLRLNAKVICQAAEYSGYHHVASAGPDCRAVLIPDGVSMDMAGICLLIGITVINMYAPSKWRGGYDFNPLLPKPDDSYWSERWHERCPAKRVELPDWVPDVTAGSSAPVALTDWKVRAIKIAITLAKRGYVTRQDFAFFKISMSRWTQQGWLKQDGRGGWINGPYMPDFRAQHPVNFPQIEADFDKWQNPVAPVQGMKQEALL
jgi:hypothetical protein